VWTNMMENVLAEGSEDKLTASPACSYRQLTAIAASRRLFAKALCVISICTHWVQLLTTAERGRCSGVETDSRSAGHEITRILRIPKVHYRVHNSQWGDSSPHSTPYFFEVRFNIILQATAWPRADGTVARVLRVAREKILIGRLV
jgi:hypothetical protein